MKLLALLCASFVALSAVAEGLGAPVRVEAKSSTLLAVGLVHGDHMTIHLSRLIDNAPVRDAVVDVLMRGVVHPTTAEADGSYLLQSKDLELPGSSQAVFQVALGGTREDLTGNLQVGDPPQPQDKNGARQFGWWVLNFAVCIGFLMLWSRRRKAAAQDD